MKKSAIFILVILFSFTQNNLFALKGRTFPVTITGPVTNKSITFTVYLPEGYDNSTDKYPVLYHLHGIGGTHNGNQITTVPASLEKAIASGIAGPMIIVFPDGYNDSFWADSYDMKIPAETNIIQEIIPYIDQNYRTINTREKRIISGFSMGGFGTAKFITKYPDYFKVAVIYDGALLTWEGAKSRHAATMAKLFNSNVDNFNKYSPWFHLKKNAADLKSKIVIRQVVGQLVDNNRNFLDSLTKYTIASEYVETTCDHVLQCLLDQGGQDSWKFIGSNIGGLATGLSIDVQNGNNEFSIFPNPSNSFISVTGYSGEAKIYNGMGNIIWIGNIPENRRIDVSIFNVGLYVLCANNEKIKFLVKR
ncbi:MAG: alpha/beta hydrolase-fold protein [Bacteroidota bacterium]|nr:alpha/beta hydrolase-fold protein [Bacteroidota bacterium]